MIICQKCGHVLRDNTGGYYYCPKCGKLVYFMELRFK